ncbi:MAG: 50S ribosomal protein L7/L12, partial [Cyanobacteriota bacterium]|nr:50S ribosomal protein L7/L12 [Cyanobacteriota bacterium]
ETSELVKQIENTFNVDASRSQINLPTVIDNITDEKEAENQQTEFDVVLEEVPSNQKIAILKLVRGITGLSLKETKDFVDSAPKAIKSGISIAEAEDIKQQLEAVEAKVSLK